MCKQADDDTANRDNYLRHLKLQSDPMEYKLHHHEVGLWKLGFGSICTSDVIPSLHGPTSPVIYRGRKAYMNSAITFRKKYLLNLPLDRNKMDIVVMLRHYKRGTGTKASGKADTAGDGRSYSQAGSLLD
ncbi:hypothetical protein MUK42_36002 [Musa troglodytarum]|uniref:Uncharacterized protein n=1 Tax=Musa troglodytarum TaxID=320322 RepID=A0A9E7I334_9LILI|nr:hypothetical protein MUK42_36002 [Musa troglodytarum]